MSSPSRFSPRWLSAATPRARRAPRVTLTSRISRYRPLALAAGLAAGAAAWLSTSSAEAACGLPYVDVWNSTDPANYVLVGTIQTIQTAQTGAQHYSYSSSSGHPSGVNLGALTSNLWVHQSTNGNGVTFGFIFSKDNGVVSNTAKLNFRIVGSSTDPTVTQSDDPGEAVETPAGTNAFKGTFSYGDNTDGLSVSGLGGGAWTVIVDSVSFGNVTKWFAANGATSAFSDDISLVLGNEYRLTPACNPPSGKPAVVVLTDTDGDGLIDDNDNCPTVQNVNQANNDGDGAGDVCDPDDDNDGVPDVSDNCATVSNADQANNDGDSSGNACDADDDNDGVLDASDNCPFAGPASQTDTDGDGAGDVCDPDIDGDTVLNASDNCPAVANYEQVNTDGDGAGDLCDPDDDNDGVADGADNCPTTPNADQANGDGDVQGDMCDGDDDGDGVADGEDNCPVVDNPLQENLDGDAAGDLCDPDDDGDGAQDPLDNCPTVANADQASTDADDLGDACDADDDGDAVVDDEDNCPLLANAGQQDLDSDGQGDACDADDDGDGVPDAVDNCAAVSNEYQDDDDGDGLGDACDADDDNDGVLDASDNCPGFPTPNVTDTDGDGQGDDCDGDDDGDGVADGEDNCHFTANAEQADDDDDSVGDACDGDDDGDGVDDVIDNCAFDPNPGQADIDADSLGDVCDEDDDGDSAADLGDNCPAAANPTQLDTDGDQQGDACDADDDNDGIADGADNCAVTANPAQADADGDGLGDACDPDVDGDGVENGIDACAATPANTPVDPATGCSIAQLCPCSGPAGQSTPWTNHAQYVSCVSASASTLLGAGAISSAEKDALIAAAASSTCGEAPGCVTIQRGGSGNVWEADLGESNGNWAAGSYPWTWTGLSPLVHRTLLKFDMSAVPAGATVTSATAYVYESWNENVSTVRAHQVLYPWQEASVAWTNFGANANFSAAVIASFTGGGVGYKTFDLTGIAAGWVSGTTANNGVLLEEDLAPPTKIHSFAGSEVGKTSMRPKLVVCYAF